MESGPPGEGRGESCGDFILAFYLDMKDAMWTAQPFVRDFRTLANSWTIIATCGLSHCFLSSVKQIPLLFSLDLRRPAIVCAGGRAQTVTGFLLAQFQGLSSPGISGAAWLRVCTEVPMRNR